ncbi:MAG: lysophospholipid acyltransferase family protein [Chloroflexota bacterium]
MLTALPERPLVVAANVVGEVWYRAAPRRARMARRNLRRVAVALAAQDRGPESARRAATDSAALERLVRAAFRHLARYYLEVARVGGVSVGQIDQRLIVETPDTVDAAAGADGPAIIVGLHFGAIELPALYFAHRLGRSVTGPMEEVTNPGVQAWFVRSRSRAGLRLVTLRAARRELIAALRRGESVGMVADRDLTGGGIEVPFFGSPAPLPGGPALIALETGAPIYAGAVRRGADGRYYGRLTAVPVPTEGSRRERITGAVAAMARVFEDVVATDPAQWWACFHPVWRDTAAPR